jgi:cytochrome c oxidase accessory protein FixG
LLYSLAPDGSRKWVDPVLTRGRFFKVRRVLAWGLMALFVTLPHVTAGGKPGLFLDLAHRQFTFMGVTLHPTDNLLLLALGASVIIGVFAITSLFGRLWCGYGCPQTVYMEFLYRPVERFFEGSPAERRRRDQGPPVPSTWLRTGGKWLVWVVVSLFLSVTFVSYFVSWDGAVHGFLAAPARLDGTLIAVLATAGLMLVDFGSFRDQMCTMACPYGRLQTVLYDPDTLIVGYDQKRGEPRGKKRAPGGGETAKQGDCVDCLRCNTTCPTGMDIRRGLQMECIGCAQCIEACDDVMSKLGRPRGLIRYTSLRELDTGVRRFLRPRVFAYVGLFALAGSALVGLALTRAEARVEILRGGREPFRVLPTGEIANILRVRLTNNQPAARSFTVALAEPAGSSLVVSRSPFPVAGNRVDTVDVVAKLPQSAFLRGQVLGRFIVQSDVGTVLRKDFLLLGPYQ